MDKNLIRLAVIVRRFFVYQARQQDWDTHLGGWCLLASRTLEAILTHFGYPAFTVGTYDLKSHFWVEVGSRYILDLTATQFGVIKPIVFLDKQMDEIPSRYTQEGNVLVIGAVLEAVHECWHKFAVTDDITEPYVNEILNWINGIKIPTKIEPFLEVVRNRIKALTEVDKYVILKV